MDILVKRPPEGEKDKVTIEVGQVTARILRAIEMLSHPDDLTVYQENKVSLLAIPDIFYIETVDTKTYVYAESEVYLSKLRLAEIENLLDKGDFIRISKQVLVNLQKIESIYPVGGGRFQAQLSNKEEIIISRQFVPKLKEVYGI